MTRATSVYLDLVRFLAAMVVFIDHLTSPRLIQFGLDAVIVFFVLSGYVIAYTSEQKEKTVDNFMIARLARLWSIAIPALILTGAIDAIGFHISPENYSENLYFSVDPYPPARLLANAFFISQIWFLRISPGTNGPFWSLSYEFWYYVLFATYYFLVGWRRVAGLLVASLIAGPVILALAPIWVIGVLMYRIRWKASPGFGWVLFVLPIALYIVAKVVGLREIMLLHPPLALPGAYRIADNLWYYFVGLLIGAHFMALRGIGDRLGKVLAPFAKFIKTAAYYTLSIYLFHNPLLVLGGVLLHDPLFTAKSAETSTIDLLVIGVGVFAIVLALGRIFEPRRLLLRIWLSTTWSKLAISYNTGRIRE